MKLSHERWDDTSFCIHLKICLSINLSLAVNEYQNKFANMCR